LTAPRARVDHGAMEPSEPGAPGAERSTPLDRIRGLALQHVEIAPGLEHLELYTLEGLLGLLWHGERGASEVVLACGGAMGGLLGPANGLYHDLGTALAARGFGFVRVSYRRPNDLAACTLDVGAAADLAFRAGARRFVTVGHSFGGAVALNAALALGAAASGVVLLATQSAGCERAARLGDVPLLLVHGERDELLPPQASEVVHALAGGRGELEIAPGAGHLLLEASDSLRARLLAWIPAAFERARSRGEG